MQPPSEPIPGSPFAHFKDTMRKLASVSKAELDDIRKKELAKKKRRKAAKQHPSS
jgi:hypothetical protein